MTGLVWALSGQGAQLVLQVLTVAVLARLVAPAEFGLVAVAMVIVVFSEVFAQIGTGAALIQRRTLEPEHVRAGFALSASMGVLFALAAVLLANVIEAFFGMPGLAAIMRVTAVLFVINALRVVAEALLARQLRFRAIAAANFAAYLVGFACIGIPLALSGWGVWALVAAYLVHALVKAAWLIAAQRHAVLPVPAGRFFADLLGFGSGFALAQVGNFAALKGADVVVGRLLGAEALGIYGRAYQLMLLPVKVFGTALDAVLSSSMARVQDDRDLLATVYEQGVVLIALLTLPASVLLYFLAPDLVLILLGPQWGDAVAPFRVFAFVMLFRTSYRMSDSLAQATGQVFHRAWRQWVYAACVIAGALLGARQGIVGVAAGVSLATVINFSLMAHLSLARLRIGWRRFVAIHAPAAALGLLTLVATASAVWILQRANAGPVITLTVVVTVTALVLGAAIALWPNRFLGDHGRAVLTRLANHIRVARTS